MTQNDVSTSTVLDDPSTAPDSRCDMCPHPWSAHDRIGVRFCTASRASSQTDRGCVCRP